MHNNTFDVIIVGGGAAGCAAALSLARSNPTSSFLLVDNADPTHFKVGESLPPEAKRILQYLSPSIIERLLEDTQRGAHTRCTGNASVWDSPKLQETFAMMNPFGAGWHLDRAAFDESLRDYVRSICGNGRTERCAFLNGIFASVKKDEHGWVVEVTSDTVGQQSYRSRWLVDASGRKASVAQKIGAKTIKLDGLLAFYMVFASTNVDHDRRTLIEATETGWWYSSQLADQKRIVVFHTDACDSTAKTARKQDGFLQMLHEDTTHISQIINDIDYRPMSGAGTNYPRCTAAGSSFLSPFGSHEDRWCAVGDAAIAFDPLSSQGIITALRMGCSVGITVSKHLTHSASSKDEMNLESVKELFEAARKDYEQKKRYFYEHAMFNGEFWQRRRK